MTAGPAAVRNQVPRAGRIRRGYEPAIRYGNAGRRLALAIAAAFVPVVSLAPAAAQETGVVVARAALPVVSGAYHGGTHVFLGGRARLTCSTHGVFSTSVDPPRAPGTTTIADYRATFTGELALEPPLVPRPVVHRIEENAHMVERLGFRERRGRAEVLETEMVTLDLQGPAMPEGVLVRESPDRVSSGRTTITPLAGGRFRVESFYDVWLEISLDGGRSWSPAEAPVRMSIAPAARPARLAPGG